MRFCTRCSFPLTTVKELVITEVAKNKPEEERKNRLLRQQDISLGAGLMIIGLIKSIVIQIGFGGRGRSEELLWLTLAFGLFFGAVLMFSQLSPRQRGLTLGATLIFIGALMGVAVGLFGGGPPALLTIVGITLLISLFWTRLSDAFTRLFFEKDSARESHVNAPFQPVFNSPVFETPMIKAADTAQPLLPRMQSSMFVELNPHENEPKEKAQPFSITEDSTSFLNKG